MTPVSVVLALGSNLGDRMVHLRRGVEALRGLVRIARISPVYETEALDSPAGSPQYLNIVVVGSAHLPPYELLSGILAVESSLGRRRSVPNAPRTIDIDLILYGAQLVRSRRLLLPHARYTKREFVLQPLRDLALGWEDPATGIAIDELRGEGDVRRAGGFY